MRSISFGRFSWGLPGAFLVVTMACYGGSKYPMLTPSASVDNPVQQELAGYSALSANVARQFFAPYLDAQGAIAPQYRGSCNEKALEALLGSGTGQLNVPAAFQDYLKIVYNLMDHVVAQEQGIPVERVTQELVLTSAFWQNFVKTQIIQLYDKIQSVLTALTAEEQAIFNELANLEIAWYQPQFITKHRLGELLDGQLLVINNQLDRLIAQTTDWGSLKQATLAKPNGAALADVAVYDASTPFRDTDFYKMVIFFQSAANLAFAPLSSAGIYAPNKAFSQGFLKANAHVLSEQKDGSLAIAPQYAGFLQVQDQTGYPQGQLYGSGLFTLLFAISPEGKIEKKPAFSLLFEQSRTENNTFVRTPLYDQIICISAINLVLGLVDSVFLSNASLQNAMVALQASTLKPSIFAYAPQDTVLLESLNTLMGTFHGDSQPMAQVQNIWSDIGHFFNEVGDFFKSAFKVIDDVFHGKFQAAAHQFVETLGDGLKVVEAGLDVGADAAKDATELATAIVCSPFGQNLVRQAEASERAWWTGAIKKMNQDASKVTTWAEDAADTFINSSIVKDLIDAAQTVAAGAWQGIQFIADEAESVGLEAAYAIGSVINSAVFVLNSVGIVSLHALPLTTMQKMAASLQTAAVNHLNQAATDLHSVVTDVENAAEAGVADVSGFVGDVLGKITDDPQLGKDFAGLMESVADASIEYMADSANVTIAEGVGVVRMGADAVNGVSTIIADTVAATAATTAGLATGSSAELAQAGADWKATGDAIAQSATAFGEDIAISVLSVATYVIQEFEDTVKNVIKMCGYLVATLTDIVIAEASIIGSVYDAISDAVQHKAFNFKDAYEQNQQIIGAHRQLITQGVTIALLTVATIATGGATAPLLAMNIGMGVMGLIAGAQEDQMNIVKKDREEAFLSAYQAYVTANKPIVTYQANRYTDELNKKFAAAVVDQERALGFFEDYMVQQFDAQKLVAEYNLGSIYSNILTTGTLAKAPTLVPADPGYYYGMQTDRYSVNMSQGLLIYNAGRQTFAQEIAQAPALFQAAGSTQGAAPSYLAKNWFLQKDLQSVAQGATEPLEVEIRWRGIYELNAPFYAGIYLGGESLTAPVGKAAWSGALEPTPAQDALQIGAFNSQNKAVNAALQPGNIDMEHHAKMFVCFRESATAPVKLDIYEHEGHGWLGATLPDPQYARGTWYRMKASLAQTGTTSTLQVKFWAEDEAEPSAWDYSTSDLAVTNQNIMGVIFSSIAMEYQILTPAPTGAQAYVATPERPAYTQPTTQQAELANRIKRLNILEPRVAAFPDLRPVSQDLILQGTYLYTTDYPRWFGPTLPPTPAAAGLKAQDYLVFFNSASQACGVDPNKPVTGLLSLVTGQVFNGKGAVVSQLSPESVVQAYTQSYPLPAAVQKAIEEQYQLYLTYMEGPFVFDPHTLAVTITAVGIPELEAGQFVYTTAASPTVELVGKGADGQPLRDYFIMATVTTTQNQLNQVGMEFGAQVPAMASLVTGRVYVAGKPQPVLTNTELLSYYNATPANGGFGPLATDLYNDIMAMQQAYYTALTKEPVYFAPKTAGLDVELWPVGAQELENCQYVYWTEHSPNALLDSTGGQPVKNLAGDPIYDYFIMAGLDSQGNVTSPNLPFAPSVPVMVSLVSGDAYSATTATPLMVGLDMWTVYSDSMVANQNPLPPALVTSVTEAQKYYQIAQLTPVTFAPQGLNLTLTPIGITPFEMGHYIYSCVPSPSTYLLNSQGQPLQNAAGKPVADYFIMAELDAQNKVNRIGMQFSPAIPAIVSLVTGQVYGQSGTTAMYQSSAYTTDWYEKVTKQVLLKTTLADIQSSRTAYFQELMAPVTFAPQGVNVTMQPVSVAMLEKKQYVYQTIQSPSSVLKGTNSKSLTDSAGNPIFDYFVMATLDTKGLIAQVGMPFSSSVQAIISLVTGEVFGLKDDKPLFTGLNEADHYQSQFGTFDATLLASLQQARTYYSKQMQKPVVFAPGGAKVTMSPVSVQMFQKDQYVYQSMTSPSYFLRGTKNGPLQDAQGNAIYDYFVCAQIDKFGYISRIGMPYSPAIPAIVSLVTGEVFGLYLTKPLYTGMFDLKLYERFYGALEPQVLTAISNASAYYSAQLAKPVLFAPRGVHMTLKPYSRQLVEQQQYVYVTSESPVSELAKAQDYFVFGYLNKDGTLDTKTLGLPFASTVTAAVSLVTGNVYGTLTARPRLTAEPALALFQKLHGTLPAATLQDITAAQQTYTAALSAEKAAALAQEQAKKAAAAAAAQQPPAVQAGYGFGGFGSFTASSSSGQALPTVTSASSSYGFGGFGGKAPMLGHTKSTAKPKPAAAPATATASNIAQPNNQVSYGFGGFGNSPQYVAPQPAPKSLAQRQVQAANAAGGYGFGGF